MKALKKRNLILGVTALVLLVIFIIMTSVTHANSVRVKELTVDASSQVADEARNDIVIEPIIGESSEESSEETSETALSETAASSIKSNSSATVSSAASPTKTESASSTAQISDTSGDWNLRLVNANYILPDDFSPNLSTISMDYARDKGMQFDSRAIGALEEMCAAAKADGVRLMIISAFRTFETQQSLYNNKVNRLIAQGYGADEAKDLAATVVARPKTSEHNLGLAVDINSVEEDFDQTEAYKWLQLNCTKYGFIMRYPKSKESITGVIYEPWHYRYVGVSVAEQITKKGITLEEYLGKN